MGIQIGQQLGSFEVTALLGKGGMGEVYRARDSKLKRDVAIKILPEEFSRDADRVSRFQREAEVLASLNHANIAAIHDLQEANGTRFLILELVEGQTLAERIASGPIPMEETLAIARQICEAVEAAHEKGIIHRDLKPGNVKVLPDGKVKVLDFGLAKAIERRIGNFDRSNSPTLLSSVDTESNTLLGTLPYMAPEQLRGHNADERSDVWAFGCVLYEMLTGRQAFRGETTTDLTAEIMRVDPEWNALPARTPPAVRLVLRRCLEKDRKRSLHAIGDVRIGLEEQVVPIAAAQTPKKLWKRFAAAGVAVVVFAVSLFVGARYFSRNVAPAHTSRFQIELPVNARIGDGSTPYPMVSPDGRYVAFVANPGGGFRLWIRPVDSLDAQQLPGTEGIDSFQSGALVSNFWSPDSRFIAFSTPGKLKKVAIAGGPPQEVCDLTNVGPQSGTWSQNDIIVFSDQGSLYRVRAAGGISTDPQAR